MIKFIAMEYFWIGLNRTLEVRVNEEGILGIKVYGIRGAFPNYLNKRYEDPEAYSDKAVLDWYDAKKLNREGILKITRANFFLPYQQIGNSEFDERRLPTMGPLPHSGVLKIFGNDGKVLKKLILLGKQDGRELEEKVRHALELPENSR